MVPVAIILIAMASTFALYGFSNLLGGGGLVRHRKKGKRPALVMFFIRLGSSVQRYTGVDLRLKRKSIDAKLHRAGIPGYFGAGEFIALKLGAASFAFAFSLTIAATSPGRLAYLFVILAPIAAYLIPDWLLYRMSARRSAMVVRELPDFLDLLRVSVEAGLPVQRSLELVADRAEGPLGRECGQLVRERKLGAEYGDTLQRLADRVGTVEVDRFVSAYSRSERLGVTVSESLSRQSHVTREERKRAVQEKAARCGPKIQLVVALVLVPAVLLLFAAVIMGQMLGGVAGSAAFG